VTAFVGVKPGKAGATLMGGYLRSKNGLLLSFEDAEAFVRPGSAAGKQGKPTFKVRAEGAVGRVRRRTTRLIDWSKPFPENQKVTGNLVQATHFCFGSSLLTPAARQLLRVVCADQLAALDSPTSRIWIIGHTDRPGKDPRNQELSMLRAKNVATALKDILGDALNREVKDSILVLGFGEWLARFKLREDRVRHPADRRVDLLINGSLVATFRE
jgi:outer membrane protein OmpA-like peptidoglycan-associated protein